MIWQVGFDHTTTCFKIDRVCDEALTDDLWARLEPLIPVPPRRSATSAANAPMTALPGGILYAARTGIGRNRLPPRCSVPPAPPAGGGSRKWQEAGVWRQLHETEHLIELVLQAQQRLPAELDRLGVHGAAPFHPALQWLPLPRRAGDRDRRLPAPAQPALPSQAAFRCRLQDPPARLPTQRCVT